MGIEDLDKFIRNQEERFEGKFPGVKERVEGLAAEGIGRSISVQTIGKMQRQQRIIGSDKIGYILPVNTENTEHVVLFNTGDVVVIISTPGYMDNYRTNFSPSEEPLSIFADDGNSLPATVDQFLSYPFFHRIIMRNSNPDQQNQVISKFEQALELAKIEKAKRESAKRESLEREGGIFDRIDMFLRGDKPKPELPPQSEPPTQ